MSPCATDRVRAFGFFAKNGWLMQKGIAYTGPGSETTAHFDPLDAVERASYDPRTDKNTRMSIKPYGSKLVKYNAGEGPGHASGVAFEIAAPPGMTLVLLLNRSEYICDGKHMGGVIEGRLSSLD